MTHKIFRPRCKDCGEHYSKARWDKGYVFCLPCGDIHAKAKKWTVAIPYAKGAYQLIHDPKDLFNTNQKHTRS